MVPGIRICEAAQLLGVSTATLRLWERQGLIQPVRTPGGNRRYQEDDLARLRHIQYLRRVERLNAAAIARALTNAPSVRPGGSGPNRENPGLGDRLRAKRRRAGFTLKQVAERTGLSISFLSAIERGVTGPSVSTLNKLTKSYGITILDLLDGQHGVKRLVRTAERPQLPGSGSGVTVEHLALGTLQMEPQLFSVQPGAGSEGAYDHIGEEFIFVLAGTLEIWLEELEHYLLTPGDCLYFPSTLPHRWRNPGSEETKLLWVNTPPTF